MTLNFANITTSDFVLKGTGQNVHIKAKTPQCLKKDLMCKRLLCQSVHVTTNSIPRFIPTLATEARYAYQNGATVTAWDNIGVANPLERVTNTDYFVNIRSLDNTECYTSELFWNNMNNVEQPPYYVPDNTDVFYIPYYYCYDIINFLDIIANALNIGFVQATGAPLTYNCAVLFDAETNTVSINVPTNLGNAWNIELGPSLADLLGMATTNINLGTFVTKQIKWSPLLVDINGVAYLSVSAKLQPNFFPFDRYVISSSLPVTPVTFHVSTDPIEGGALQQNVVFMWRPNDMQIQSGYPITITNDNMFEKQKTFEQDTFTDIQIEFKLLVRIKKNQNWIEWVIPDGEQMEITLNTVRLF